MFIKNLNMYISTKQWKSLNLLSFFRELKCTKIFNLFYKCQNSVSQNFKIWNKTTITSWTKAVRNIFLAWINPIDLNCIQCFIYYSLQTDSLHPDYLLALLKYSNDCSEGNYENTWNRNWANELNHDRLVQLFIDNLPAWNVMHILLFKTCFVGRLAPLNEEFARINEILWII